MKTLALSIIFTLALGISQAAIWPNPFTTNSGTALLYQGSADSTETNSGLMSSNAWVQSEWMPNQGEGAFRTPPLGVAGWFGAFDGSSWISTNGANDISNELRVATQTLSPFGYNYFILDDGWGNTNLGPNGLMQLHQNISNYFGSGTLGVSNFITCFHTNGWKVGFYVDGDDKSYSNAGFQHGLGDTLLRTNVETWGRFGLDFIKSSHGLFDLQIIASSVAQTGYPILLSAVNQNKPLPTIFPAMMNDWRIAAGGDITSYAQLLNWTDAIQSNKWYSWAHPGRFIDLDYVGGERQSGDSIYATKTHLVLCALLSAPIEDDAALSDPSQVWFTNRDLLAIDQDPAVIAAQRLIQTNNCDVYLKPLGSQAGPQYALGILNRSTLTPTNVTLYFTNLAPLFASGNENWSAYDCVSNSGWVCNNTNQFTVSLSTNDSRLWRLKPGYFATTNVVSVSYPDSITLNVVSNGTPMTVYSGWDVDASNYVARAGLTNQTEIIAAAEAVCLGKQHGWWNKMDCLYLFMGSTSNSTAQNMMSPNYGVQWHGGVTFAWDGATADGSTGYGDTQFTPSTASSPKYTAASAFEFAYVQSTSLPNVNGRVIGAQHGTGYTILYGASPNMVAVLNNLTFTMAPNWVTDGITGNASGPWACSREDSFPVTIGASAYKALAYHSFQIDAGDTTASTGVPDVSVFIFASNAGAGATLFQAGTLSAIALGGGFNPSEYAVFLNDMNVVENMRRLKIP